MKTLSINEAKRKLGQVADEALRGRPILIARKSRLLILQPFTFPEPIPQRPPGYFKDCHSHDEIKEANYLASQGQASIHP